MVELASLLEEFPDDLTSRWLYNLAAQTVGDYPDRVPARWLIPEETFDSEYPLDMFTNVAPANGLATVGLAGGAVMDDFNGDGHLDVMASSWGYRDALRLYINQTDGQFAEGTQGNGLNGITGGLNLVHADFDNDGDPDVFVLRGGWLLGQGRQPNSLLVNDGAGHFADQTEQAGLLSFHPTQTAAWGDYDNDGWIDLVIGNEIRPGSTHPGELYRNNGDGTFSEVADRVGLRITGFVKAVVWGDYNNDGWIDLYVSRMGQTNQLFRNNGPDVTPQFNDVTELAGVAEPVNSFPAWFWDMDNDGWLDLFVADFSSDAYGADRNAAFVTGEVDRIAASYLGEAARSMPRVYRNLGDGTFEDITQSARLDLPLLAMGVNYGDIDNDGFPDMYIGTGDPDFQTLIPNRMFRNDEGLAFQDVTTSAGVGHLQKGHGIAFGDLDNDGDQDVYAVMGGAYSGDVFQNAMFLNPGNDNNWVTIRLQGVTANRSAIGARLRLETTTPDGRQTVHKLLGSGGSFGANSLQQEIGLGRATRIDSLTIEWPGASTQVFTDIEINQTLLIVEGEPEPRVLLSERIEITRN